MTDSTCIPLSSVRRARRRMPQLRSLAAPVWLGDWEARVVQIVGLHVHGAYETAKEAARSATPLRLEREPENEHDPDAVACYLPDGRGGWRLLGYVAAEDAPEISDALLDGAPLRAAPLGCKPWSGKGSKGGALDVIVEA